MPDFGIMRGFNEKLFGDKLVAGQLPTQLGLIGSENYIDYLLDAYPNASLAYSLRLIRRNYTGNAIRVRRSSDNSEQNIGFIGTNLDTTALTSFCGSGNGFVTTWFDQSGSGRNATQTTAANQPQIVSSGSVLTVNSKPSVYFNNKNSVCMNFTSITTQSFTIVWVSKKDSTVGDGSIIIAGSVGGGQYIGDDVDNSGNPTAYADSPLVTIGRGNTTASGNEINQHLSYLNRRNSNQAVGQFNNSTNSYNNSSTVANAVMQSLANYGSGYNYLGRLQEIIIYTLDKSADRTGISTDINTYYGIY